MMTVPHVFVFAPLPMDPKSSPLALAAQISKERHSKSGNAYAKPQSKAEAIDFRTNGKGAPVSGDTLVQ